MLIKDIAMILLQMRSNLYLQIALLPLYYLGKLTSNTLLPLRALYLVDAHVSYWLELLAVFANGFSRLNSLVKLKIG